MRRAAVPRRITCSAFFYAYLQGRASDQAKLDSKYYQRYIARHDAAPPAAH